MATRFFSANNKRMEQLTPKYYQEFIVYIERRVSNFQYGRQTLRKVMTQSVIDTFTCRPKMTLNTRYLKRFTCLMHLASINALAFLVNTREGVDKTQRNTIISGFTLRSVFVKAITGVRYSPLYIYYELLVLSTQTHY